MKSGEKVCTWLLLFLIIGVASCSIPAFPALSSLARDVLANQPDTRITIQRTPGRAIDPNFVGFSTEVSQLCNIIQLDAQNPFYAQLYKNLGSSVLRIEGNTIDVSVWSPHGTASCDPNHLVVTEDLVNHIFAFARKIHWKITWGLNLIANNPSVAADEASYVVRAGGAQLASFSIGNEPELYAQDGYRPSAWGYQNYRYEWEHYKRQILQRVRTKFVGPDACCETSFFTDFVHDEVPVGLDLVSHHFYATTSTTTGSEAPSIPFLLSARTRQMEHSYMQSWLDNMRGYQTPLALTEVNSISGGGLVGISDTLASALWADDFLFQSAEMGISSVEFHSAPNAAYNPIDQYGNVRPLYYGLMLFHYMTAHAHLLKVSVKTSSNIVAYALVHDDGKIDVVVINNNMTKDAAVAIDSGTFYQATGIRLTAASITARRGVSLGQRKLSWKDTWSPRPVPVSMSGHEGYIELPAGNAEIVTFG